MLIAVGERKPCLESSEKAEGQAILVRSQSAKRPIATPTGQRRQTAKAQLRGPFHRQS